MGSLLILGTQPLPNMKHPELDHVVIEVRPISQASDVIGGDPHRIVGLWDGWVSKQARDNNSNWN